MGDARRRELLRGQGRSPMTLSFRLGSPQWLTDAQWGRLLELLGAHRPAVDPAIELGLMTIGSSHSTHGGHALEVLWARGLGELTGVRPGKRVRATARQAMLVTPQGPSPLAVLPGEGEVRVAVPALGPWQPAVILGS